MFAVMGNGSVSGSGLGSGSESGSGSEPDSGSESDSAPESGSSFDSGSLSFCILKRRNYDRSTSSKVFIRYGSCGHIETSIFLCVFCNKDKKFCMNKSITSCEWETTIELLRQAYGTL